MSKKLWSTKANETPEFVEFWETWRPMARETDGRGDARDTFLEHIKRGSDPQDMVDGAKWFLRHVLKDREFIPLATSYLNRRGYEDHAEEYRAYEAKRNERKQERPRESEQENNVVDISPDRRSELVAKAKALVGGVRLREA